MANLQIAHVSSVCTCTLFSLDCNISYQVIGRKETYEDDVKYILLKQNLTSLIPLESSKKTLHAVPKNVTAKKTDYMAQLSKDQIEGLYKMYQIDFEMFGYDVDKY